jgi:hypothetical protein
MKIMYTIEYKRNRAILTSIMRLEVIKTALSAHISKTIKTMKTDMPMKCWSDYYCLEDYESWVKYMFRVRYPKCI